MCIFFDFEPYLSRFKEFNNQGIKCSLTDYLKATIFHRKKAKQNQNKTNKQKEKKNRQVLLEIFLNPDC